MVLEDAAESLALKLISYVPSLAAAHKGSSKQIVRYVDKMACLRRSAAASVNVGRTGRREVDRLILIVT